MCRGTDNRTPLESDTYLRPKNEPHYVDASTPESHWGSKQPYSSHLKKNKQKQNKLVKFFFVRTKRGNWQQLVLMESGWVPHPKQEVPPAACSLTVSSPAAFIQPNPSPSKDTHLLVTLGHLRDHTGCSDADDRPCALWHHCQQRPGCTIAAALSLLRLVLCVVI